VQLQSAQERFKHQGIGLAGISYDSEAILKDFAERQHITFPLLADPQSEIISRYNVLNVEAKGMTKGMAHPGFVYVDPSGNVKAKFFEVAYTDRYTANNLIGKIFPELTEQVERNVGAPHISLNLQQSDRIGVPGSRITLIAEVKLGRDLHVYAPGVKGYIPIELDLKATPELRLDTPVYPKPMVLFLPAIRERVPVFEGKFHISQDVTVSAERPFRTSLGPGQTVSLQGVLKYQVCDKKICYAPTSVPVSWEIQVSQLDVQRSPEQIRHH
jgi:hypothetical protein